MTSPPSSSDATPPEPAAFDRLHEGLRRWIWDRGWTELRDLQEAAIPPILTGEVDVLLAASTASGKTEAAFFPICSRIAASPAPGLRALYVSPLKALINDQLRRLEDLCARLEIPVHRWHGDVSSTSKRRLIADPRGLLLITPESLEALFMLHGPRIPVLFGALEHVVIDELHAFIGSERGRQLQSLLHRIEFAIGRRVPRVALSATLGDMALAAEFLRPRRGEEVHRITSSRGAAELRLMVRGYLMTPPREGTDEAAAEDAHLIADHLFRALRGTDNLVFANRRADVEIYTDLLARRSERERVPNEFFAHHGSLSKELREDVEARLKKEILGPVTVVCTSTLEMGIDIGSMKSVAQIGAPSSVASLRQRLGRSGRREGDAAVLRVYVREELLTADTPPEAQIRAELVQALAVLRLLLDRWCEPPEVGALHLSTLVQQVLSMIAQRGGLRAQEAFRVLCETGPFSGVTRTMFSTLLRGLGQRELLAQDSDGTLLLGPRGERLVNHYSFYAVFQTPDEYRLVCKGRTLGALPMVEPLLEGMYLIFGGRRYLVVAVDQDRRVVDLVPAKGGRVPSFGARGHVVHDRVRKEMRAIYELFEIPPFVDARARDLLVEARMSFERLGLRDRPLIAHGRDTLFFPWAGDRVMNTILVQMAKRGFQVAQTGVALRFSDAPIELVEAALRSLVEAGSEDAVALSRSVKNKILEKYDGYLIEDLLCATYASIMLDPEEAVRCLERTLGEGG